MRIRWNVGLLNDVDQGRKIVKSGESEGTYRFRSVRPKCTVAMPYGLSALNTRDHLRTLFELIQKSYKYYLSENNETNVGEAHFELLLGTKKCTSVSLPNKVRIVATTRSERFRNRPRIHPR